MSKAIQSQTKSNPDNSRHGLFHKIIFVLRRGLKRNHEFLDLFPYLKIFFPWRSCSFITVFIFAVATASAWCSTVVSAASLTLSITNSSAAVNLVVASQDGTFASSTADSNDIAFSIASTNPTGYTLSIMGDNDDGLLTGKKDSSFSSITSAISEATFSSRTTLNGKWGYKPSKLDSATNTNYLPAPTTVATILDETTSANTTANEYTIAVGARADFSMETSDYTNTFKLIVISNPLPVMQDFTYEMCQASAADSAVTLTDARDGKEYSVRHINGVCTMTQNLALEPGAVLSSADTNLASGGTYSVPSNATFVASDYTTESVTCSSTDNYGCYYNYQAATAGTIVGDSNTIEAAYDICPNGWRLPTGYDGGEQYTINDSYAWREWNAAYLPSSTSVKPFTTIAAGRYYDGTLDFVEVYGRWWSSSANNDIRYYLGYNTADGLRSGLNNTRDHGFSIRCVAEKSNTLITFDGNGGTATANNTGDNTKIAQRIENGTSAALLTNTFTRGGYIFTGWNTAADGSGSSYSDAATYTATASTTNSALTLYAQWEKDPIVEFNGIRTMQTMTTSVCSDATAGTVGRLEDTRDGKIYWIAKLADGNCWMTQNLDLDITADGLSATDTDITSDWTASSSIDTDGRLPITVTATGNPPTSGCNTQTIVNGTTTYTDTCSYDPGDYVLKKPASWQYTSTTTNLASNSYIQNVSGSTSDYSVGESTLTSSSVTYSGTSYDAHYHLGNYYQFNVATAGKGVTVTSSQGQIADSSICPKGWKLPLSGTNYNNTSGSYYNLLNSYGIATSSSANSLNYVSAPLYMVPGGYVYYNSNGLRYAGNVGNYWSRVSYDASNGYDLSFGSSLVYPSSNYNRYGGFSVRCVVPTS